jgi:hypothetical protein
MHELFNKLSDAAVIALAVVAFAGIIARFAVYAYCDVRDIWRRRARNGENGDVDRDGDRNKE